MSNISNNYGHYYGGYYNDYSYEEKKCECGAECLDKRNIDYGKHSDWCPKYKEED